VGSTQDVAGALVWRALPPIRARLLEHWITGGTRLGAAGRRLFAGLSHAVDREYYGQATTTARREAVGWLQTRGTSTRRACRVVGLSRATWRYQRRADPQNVALLDRLQAHAMARPRFGYRRLHILVGREGLRVNHKRLYRLYRAAGLQVRRRRRKRLTRGDRVPRCAGTPRRICGC